MSLPRISVVVPAHNEEGRLHLALTGLASDVASKLDEINDLEVIVVSDGSTDSTVAVAHALLEKLSLHGSVVDLSPCRGKGGALAEGFRVARGRFCFFTDADLATPVETLWRMLPLLERGEADVVIGSRRLAGSRIVHPQGALRQFLGSCFTALSNMVLGTQVSDFTCGFKGYTARAAREIYSRLTIHRWAYDAEALFIAKRLGFSVSEICVVWADVEGSKVRAGSAVLESLWDLLLIRWRARRD